MGIYYYLGLKIMEQRCSIFSLFRKEYYSRNDIHVFKKYLFEILVIHIYC